MIFSVSLFQDKTPFIKKPVRLGERVIYFLTSAIVKNEAIISYTSFVISPAANDKLIRPSKSKLLLQIEFHAILYL